MATGFAQKRGLTPYQMDERVFRTTAGLGSVPLFVQSHGDQKMSERIMGLLLVSATLGLTGVVWVSRVRFARRFHAALDAYAELETVRERSKTHA